jgi:hypothetical protein
MPKLRLTLAGLLLLVLAVLALAPAALAAGSTAPTAAASALSGRYAFVLTGANTASATMSDDMTAPGDWISVRGGGVFDPAAGTVTAGGTFVHYTADGAVHCRGTWQATALTGFTAFGPARSGRTGGVLDLVVSHHCATMDMDMTGIPMTVTSTLNAPAGAVEGITMGPFTAPLRGGVLLARG